MAVSRKDLIDLIRTNLDTWPIHELLKAKMTKTDRTIQIDEDLIRGFIGPSTLIEIGSEVMKVVDVPKDGTAVRVIRRHQNTTAADHQQNDAMKIYPDAAWTDSELLRNLKAAIRWLKPFAWVHTLSDEFTWESDELEATVPTATGISTPDGNYMSGLLYKNQSDSKFYPFHGWRLDGTRIRFRKTTGQDVTLKAEYTKFQAVLTSDSDTLDTDDFEEAVANYASHLSINRLAANRVRFAMFAAALNDRTSTPDELIRMSFHFKNQAILSREDHGRPLPSGFASTYIEPVS